MKRTSYDRAGQLAELPDLIRGYESVWFRSIEWYAVALCEVRVRFSSG